MSNEMTPTTSERISRRADSSRLKAMAFRLGLAATSLGLLNCAPAALEKPTQPPVSEVPTSVPATPVENVGNNVSNQVDSNIDSVLAEGGLTEETYVNKGHVARNSTEAEAFLRQNPDIIESLKRSGRTTENLKVLGKFKYKDLQKSISMLFPSLPVTDIAKLFNEIMCMAYLEKGTGDLKGASVTMVEGPTDLAKLQFSTEEEYWLFDANAAPVKTGLSFVSVAHADGGPQIGFARVDCSNPANANHPDCQKPAPTPKPAITMATVPTPKPEQPKPTDVPTPVKPTEVPATPTTGTVLTYLADCTQPDNSYHVNVGNNVTYSVRNLGTGAIELLHWNNKRRLPEVEGVKAGQVNIHFSEKDAEKNGTVTFGATFTYRGEGSNLEQESNECHSELSEVEQDNDNDDNDNHPKKKKTPTPTPVTPTATVVTSTPTGTVPTSTPTSETPTATLTATPTGTVPTPTATTVITITPTKETPTVTPTVSVTPTVQESPTPIQPQPTKEIPTATPVATNVKPSPTKVPATITPPGKPEGTPSPTAMPAQPTKEFTPATAVPTAQKSTPTKAPATITPPAAATKTGGAPTPIGTGR